jgi:hypothetical protein
VAETAPNGWILGSVTGVAVDAQERLDRSPRPASLTARTEAGTGTTPPTAELCCKAAPPSSSSIRPARWSAASTGRDGIDKPVARGIAVDARHV